ncbi:MAG: ABC transporter permease [Bryobacterales bacterium]|nr:ABC transporter permease [Bryobacterales bacterium]
MPTSPFSTFPLFRHPAFTFVAVLSLALGTGANTAIFSLLNSLLLHMLPVPNPAQLVELLQKYPGEPRGNGFWSTASYQHFRDHNHVFTDLMGASGPLPLPARRARETETVHISYVTPNFFAALGLRPALGRLLGPEDNETSAVVSWSYWKNRFGADQAVPGKRITVQDQPLTIVGVAPAAFPGLQLGAKTDIWLLRPAASSLGLALIARTRPGVSLDQARAEMSVLYRFTIEERARKSKDPLVRQLKVEVEPAGAGLSFLRDRFAKPLLALMAVVAALLLLACANLAGMLLARAAGRQRDMAVRLALGASPLQLAWQVLAEALFLAAMGTLAGAGVAYLGVRGLLRVLLSGRPMIGLPGPLEIDVQPDAHVLLFTLSLSLITGVLFGLAPAWSAFSSSPVTSLREMERTGQTRPARRLGRLLVSAQIALSALLLSAAALFVGYLLHLEQLDLGFRPGHLLLLTLDPAHSGYKREQLAAPYRALWERLEAIPGVRAVSMVGASPISGAGASRFATVEGRTERPEDRRYLSLNWVAPNYFETMGTPLLAGRDFRFDDQGARLAIINQAMSDYYFGGVNAIGKHVTLDGDAQPCEIIGVVGNAKYFDIRETPPRTLYFNMFEQGRVSSQFVLRTAVPPASLAAEVRRTVTDTLKSVPVARITTMEDQISASIVPERLVATLSGWFGVLALTLAFTGVYGLLAYTVARRTHEIGIRMSLGATRTAILRMVLWDAAKMTAAGLGAGGLLTVWARSFAAALVPGLPAPSLTPLLFASAAITAAALLAASIPALRAARVEPAEALRYE